MTFEWRAMRIRIVHPTHETGDHEGLVGEALDHLASVAAQISDAHLGHYRSVSL